MGIRLVLPRGFLLNIGHPHSGSGRVKQKLEYPTSQPHSLRLVKTHTMDLTCFFYSRNNILPCPRPSRALWSALRRGSCTESALPRGGELSRTSCCTSLCLCFRLDLGRSRHIPVVKFLNKGRQMKRLTIYTYIYIYIDGYIFVFLINSYYGRQGVKVE